MLISRINTNFIVISITLIFSLIMKNAYSQRPEVLAPYVWNSRVLLIFAPASSDTLFSQQTQLFESQELEIMDRDLVSFSIFPSNGSNPKKESLNSNEIRDLYSFYKITSSEFCVILIGKDGGEKLRTTNELLSLPLLFSTIDAMPMRKQEMKKNHRR